MHLTIPYCYGTGIFRLTRPRNVNSLKLPSSTTSPRESTPMEGNSVLTLDARLNFPFSPRVRLRPQTQVLVTDS